MSQVIRKHVLPGELIAKGKYKYEKNVFNVNNLYYSTKLGLAESYNDKLRVIPLSGVYMPRVDDVVIGTVVDFGHAHWLVNINSCFIGVLVAKSVFSPRISSIDYDLESKFKIGDTLCAKINSFDRTRDPLLSVYGYGLGKIFSGTEIDINPNKVARLIGKKGSMIKLLEENTDVKYTIGQNGKVILKGTPDSISKAKIVIELIENESQNSNLMDKVQLLLKNKK